ncbi:hypothetical protein KDN34_02890 [Shewanella yunxiaonensis]|uniref:Uncharacterized protein n=1 Tax=Shewanella yunxiaonensis TaxID=2829809 RepID=A0ABX7YXG8_9GAMM|nr:hypothetical protein KDN34_02890 [Shewanella yunxiaonensis]
MLTFPSGVYPKECVWQLVTRTKTFRNPYNNAGGQDLTLPGAYWSAKLSFATLTRAKAQSLLGTLTALDGTAGRIQMWDHAFASPMGNGGGTPVVDGNGQTGNTLNIRNCTPSVTWLNAGDYFQCGNQLHIMIADAVTDSAGKCTLQFRAALRESPADGAAITVTQAKAIMRLVDDKQLPRRSTNSRVLSDFTIEFEEAIDG